MNTAALQDRYNSRFPTKVSSPQYSKNKRSTTGQKSKLSKSNKSNKSTPSLSVIEWLRSHNLTSPHQIPNSLRDEFDAQFEDVTILWPQPGGQTAFSNCPADICLYGGEAGSGKSFNLLFDHVKWLDNPNYIGAVVRKTYSQIFDAGGLWDEAKKIYAPLGGRAVKSPKPMFTFPSGAQIYFKHSQHAADVVENWQGLQAAVISIDELTHFTKQEFLYAMSRNRSTCGVKSYMRMTCNPDSQSWVKEFISWWIGPDGFVIPERSGTIRWFLHVDDKFLFGDSKEELMKPYIGTEFEKKIKPMSFTFIRGFLEENRKLMDIDPDYGARLENLSETDKMALSRGNWNEVVDPNALFNRNNINKYRVEFNDFKIEHMVRVAVGVDPAGGARVDNDETGIVCAGIDDDGHGYIWRDESGNYTPDEWGEKVCSVYDLDSGDIVAAERNFGGDMVESTIKHADQNINVKMVTSSRGKYLRAEPIAGLYNQGLIHHVGHELKPLEDEMCSFKQGVTKSPNKLDAAVFALTELMIRTGKKRPNIRTFTLNAIGERERIG